MLRQHDDLTDVLRGVGEAAQERARERDALAADRHGPIEVGRVQR